MLHLSPDDKLLGALFIAISIAIAVTQETWRARVIALVLALCTLAGLVYLSTGCAPAIHPRVTFEGCSACGDAGASEPADAAPLSDAALATCIGAQSGVNTYVPPASQAVAWTAAHPAPRDIADIQLQLDGQSNAEGQNIIRWEDDTPIAGLSLLGFRVASGVPTVHAWEPFAEPSNRYSTQPVSPGYGPAAALAKRIREVTCEWGDCRTVGLFVNAVSSTKLEQWARGTSSSTNKIWIEERGRAGGVRIDGVIRWLGDGNRTDPEALSKILARTDELREDFAAPCMPIIWVEIMHSTASDPTYGTAFNAQLARLPSLRPNTFVVSVAGLRSYKGDMHVDHPSAAKAGEGMADAWLRAKGLLQ